MQTRCKGRKYTGKERKTQIFSQNYLKNGPKFEQGLKFRPGPKNRYPIRNGPKFVSKQQKRWLPTKIVETFGIRSS